MKLCLGTAQFEENYGFNNIQSHNVFELLNFCQNNGIYDFDTSILYGNSIKVLSEKLEDSFKIIPLKDSIGTFNGFDINSKLSDRIDYVFTKNIKIIDYRHIDKKLPNGLWPSDHLPILVTY